jgi:hypothetical protein
VVSSAHSVLLGSFNFISREEGLEEVMDDRLDVWQRCWRTIIPEKELRGAAKAHDYDKKSQTVRKRLAEHVQVAQGVEEDISARWCFQDWPIAQLEAEDDAMNESE